MATIAYPVLTKAVAWSRTPGVSLEAILSAQTGGQTPEATLWGQFTVGAIVWIVVPLIIGLWLNHHAEANESPIPAPTCVTGFL
ncbi:hypothetical protein [Arachnia propionica]